MTCESVKVFIFDALEFGILQTILCWHIDWESRPVYDVHLQIVVKCYSLFYVKTCFNINVNTLVMLL